MFYSPPNSILLNNSANIGFLQAYMKMIFSVASYLFGIVFLGFTSCNTVKPKPVVSPKGYDFASGEKLLLVHKLEEVSGIAFVPGQDSLLLAVNDEEGLVYTINIHNSKQVTEPIRFSKAGDYEDIAFFNGKWMVLESDGALYTLDNEMAEGVNASKLNILPKGEYEGMAAWKDRLYVICKECPGNKATDATVYILKTANDSVVLESTLTIDFGEVGKGKNKKFLASALAKNPFTGEWFILSHVKGRLAIADENFMVKQLIPLRRKQFTQPEGIAFSANGDLFISNEGDGGAGYIMWFKYRN